MKTTEDLLGVSCSVGHGLGLGRALREETSLSIYCDP